MIAEREGDIHTIDERGVFFELCRIFLADQRQAEARGPKKAKGS